MRTTTCDYAPHSIRGCFAFPVPVRWNSKWEDWDYKIWYFCVEQGIFFLNTYFIVAVIGCCLDDC